MADEESRDEQWGNKVAGVTYFWTVILAAAFIGAVFVFILR